MKVFYLLCDMKVIIAGSRTFSDYEFLKTSLDSILTGSDITVISGAAEGADKLGERYAAERGFDVVQVPADWKKLGRAAGPKRNAQMAEMGDTLIAFWDGESRGTKSMIDLARKKGLLVHILKISI